MVAAYDFFVPVAPVAQPRVRARVFKTALGHRGGVYHPKGPVDAYKHAVRMTAGKLFEGQQPLTGPVVADMVFLMPRTKAQTWKRKPMVRLPFAKKPDRDNLDKAVLDALSGIAFVDDAQVFDGRVTKWTAAGDEIPGVHISLAVFATHGTNAFGEGEGQS
ncbi:MAG: RusA family crossover junction endodeoxyribonuclease [Planctomycetota bacterium]